jgi:hypothetical protein
MKYAIEWDYESSISGSEYIYITEPYNNVNNLLINKDPYINLIEPFPRSTLWIESTDGSEISELYIVDRNFILKKYELQFYGYGAITEIYSYPLNMSYINISCEDLNQINKTDNLLILFC